MSHLKLTLVQTELAWEDPAANRAHFDDLLAPLAGTTHIVVLPEMFSTGFTMAGPRLAEPMNGPSVDWMRGQAGRLNAHLAGSLIIGEGGKVYNRLVWATPEGTLYTYDKRHLFRMSGEHEVYAAGETLLTVPVGAWRIRPFVCYDLRQLARSPGGPLESLAQGPGHREPGLCRGRQPRGARRQRPRLRG